MKYTQIKITKQTSEMLRFEYKIYLFVCVFFSDRKRESENIIIALKYRMYETQPFQSLFTN